MNSTLGSVVPLAMFFIMDLGPGAGVGAPFDSKDVPLDPLEPPGRPRDSLRPLSKGRGEIVREDRK